MTDHVPVPDLTGIDPYKRVQTGWRMHHAFPTREDGLCSCGCGQKLTGRRTRWATTQCGDQAYRIYGIHAGQSSAIRRAVYERDEGLCAHCGIQCGIRLQGPQPEHLRYGVLFSPNWDADHILPVRDGGGGCGLENYQTLCEHCHKAKTKAMHQKKPDSYQRTLIWA